MNGTTHSSQLFPVVMCQGIHDEVQQCDSLKDLWEIE